MGKNGKGHQGTYVKDTWTKPKGGRIEGGIEGWARGKETSAPEQH